MLSKFTRRFFWIAILSAFMIILVGCANTEKDNSNSIISNTQGENPSTSEEEYGAYVISFDLKGGTSASGVSTISVNSLDKTKFKFDITKPNYVFAGWSCNGTKVFDSKGNVINSIQLEPTMIFEAIYVEKATLKITYALYNPKTNKLIKSFDNKPKDIGNISETNSYDWNTQVSLYANLSKEYTFVGWYYNGLALSNATNYNYMMWDTDITLEARYQYTMYDVTVYSNNTNCGQVMIKSGNSQTWYDSQTQQYYFSEPVTVAAYTKTNVRFLGWYDENNNLVSTNAVYNFDMSAKKCRLEAKWDKFNIEYDLDGGTNDSRNPSSFSSNDSDITLLNPVKTGYTFVGWMQNNEYITKIDTSLLKNMKLKALWTYYTYSLVCDNEKAGTIPIHTNEKCTVGIEKTISGLTTNSGYTFIGWYKDDEEVTKTTTLSFEMPAENVIYTAKWIANDDTVYKVEHYQQSVDATGYEAKFDLFDIDSLTGTTDTLTNGSVNKYDGFTSPTITQININGDGSTVIKLYYYRNDYEVKICKNNNDAGNIIGAGTYKYGKKITIKTTTNYGYTFNGWYKNKELYTLDLSFDYDITSSNVEFEACFTINNYIVTVDNRISNIEISGITSGNEYEYNSEITLTSTNSLSDYIIIWTRSDGVVFIGNSYRFNLPAYNITITTTRPYIREENKIYFGTYPQTLVDETNNAELISKLNEMSGSLPTSSNKGKWNLYNYYNIGVINGIYYIDMDYDKNGTYDYRGVYFTQYRPISYNYTSPSPDSSNQYENGYTTSKRYWFKYDPIEWNIIDENNEKALIIASLILDSQEIYPSEKATEFAHNGGTGYANNYELSYIRKWLNNTFYNTAFNDIQKPIIDEMTLDNNESGDYIFLLSSKEISTYFPSNNERQAKGTDYAKCQGLYVWSENSYWWSRSPQITGTAVGNYYVDVGGSFQIMNVFRSDFGVRPVCWIIL